MRKIDLIEFNIETTAEIASWIKTEDDLFAWAGNHSSIHWMQAN